MAKSVRTGHLSTPREQFSFWREVVCEALFGLWADRRERGPFEAHLELHDLGQAQVALATLPAQVLGRGPQEIARSQPAFCLHHLQEGVVHGRYRGQDYEGRPGDLLLFDTTEPCESFVVERSVTTTFLHVPRSLLGSRLGATGQAPVRLCARTGPGVLLAGYLGSLSQSTDSLPAAVRGKATDILCDLIAVSFAHSDPVLERCRGGVRQARLGAALRYIASHLGDPELGVRKAAVHLGISERSVQKLFETTGRTFSETVLTARLEACAEALRDPRESHRTIADIAFRYGFSDLSWFYRCYRAHRGETPGDTRGRAEDRPVGE